VQIAAEIGEPSRPESDIYNALLSLDDCNIAELGCGAAELTREIASSGKNRSILALEVDAIQHAKNQQIRDLPNVRFELGGAQAIPVQDDTVDVVFMFKSLHHVPLDQIAQSLQEIRRVLSPGGCAYISEPIFAGDFNEVLRLFHDEEAVRKAAFDALRSMVETGDLELVKEVFFNSSIEFSDFADFEKRVLQVTHSNHQLSEELYQQVRKQFSEKMAGNGGRFTLPIRVDLLRKPLPEQASD
jgi:ubiquinone/menaquinone biosynthesis C-methylase UbiE